MVGGFCWRCIPRWVWALCGVCFLAALWVGRTLSPRPVAAPPPVPAPVPAPTAPTTMFFVAFDTIGRKLDNPKDPVKMLSVDNVSNRQVVTGEACQLADKPGKSHTVVFEYHQTSVTETVTYFGEKSKYVGWLREYLDQKLGVNYTQNKTRWDDNIRYMSDRSNETKNYFPVLFAAP